MRKVVPKDQMMRVVRGLGLVQDPKVRNVPIVGQGLDHVADQAHVLEVVLTVVLGADLRVGPTADHAADLTADPAANLVADLAANLVADPEASHAASHVASLTVNPGADPEVNLIANPLAGQGQDLVPALHLVPGFLIHGLALALDLPSDQDRALILLQSGPAVVLLQDLKDQQSQLLLADQQGQVVEVKVVPLLSMVLLSMVLLPMQVPQHVVRLLGMLQGQIQVLSQTPQIQAQALIQNNYIEIKASLWMVK